MCRETSTPSEGSAGLVSLPHDHHVLVAEGHKEAELRIHGHTVDGGALHLTVALPEGGWPLQHLRGRQTDTVFAKKHLVLIIISVKMFEPTVFSVRLIFVIQ